MEENLQLWGMGGGVGGQVMRTESTLTHRAAPPDSQMRFPPEERREEKWNERRRAEEDRQRCRRTEVVDWVPPEILLFRFLHFFHSLPPPSLGPDIWGTLNRVGVTYVTSIKNMCRCWGSPRFLHWCSHLFSCPLSLSGMSKDYCLWTSKGAAG